MVGRLPLFFSSKRNRFEEMVLPHLDAAYNLARWLTGEAQDAEDVVQEALLRAFRFFDGFRGEDGRAWLLTIVRNTAYTWLRQNRMQTPVTSLDEEQPSNDPPTNDSEELLVQSLDRESLYQAIAALPVEFREVVILHDLEGLAYKEIAFITKVPIGTVMSRLSRARKRLYVHLTQDPTMMIKSEVSREL
jgi:RNA polymerase sigma-70 factor (ECF subfamily)